MRKLSAMNIPSTLKVSLEITLEGMFSLTKAIIHPRIHFDPVEKVMENQEFQIGLPEMIHQV